MVLVIELSIRVIQGDNLTYILSLINCEIDVCGEVVGEVVLP